jgi:DNA-3-methyladenine glycosylase
MKISQPFFLQDDVVSIARLLIGKHLFTYIDGKITGGIITEAEAYKGVTDRACHAFGGRRTVRNEMMYAQGGVIYVYLCYGIHHLLNFVTNHKDVPDAVLIRSMQPTHGQDIMLQRTGKSKITSDVTNGPGKVSKALGITTALNGTSLASDIVWVEDQGVVIPPDAILQTQRIGVDYAGADAKLPYRLLVKRDVVW